MALDPSSVEPTHVVFEFINHDDAMPEEEEDVSSVLNESSFQIEWWAQVNGRDKSNPVSLYAEAYLAAKSHNMFETMFIVDKDPQTSKFALIGAVHAGHLGLVQDLVGRVDYNWIRCACLHAIREHKTHVFKTLVDRVGTPTLNTLMLDALAWRHSVAVSMCLERGANNFTAALKVATIYTPKEILQTLLEKGGIAWPSWIYTDHLTTDREYIIQLHKMGTPHYLLVNGCDHIQAVIDQHEAWNAQVKTELGSLGVYSVLADLITQY
jgi:hypothetical protein